MGFARWQADYAAAGVPSFPASARDKRPLVRNWGKVTLGASRAWAARFPEADAIGIPMGPRSGITEVDVDVVGNAALGQAIELFGDTPIVIRTASGKSKLWYRHSGEGRAIRPVPGLEMDILGAGFTLAPPSRRDDLGASYVFVRGGLDDLAHLPPMRVSAPCSRAAETVAAGQRNDSLFRWCMIEARACDDVEALIDAAQTWASAMPDRLPPAEVERCARSAWRYESTGRNFLGLKRPQVTEADVLMDALLDEPEALVLFYIFRRYHSGRPHFAIVPRAMANAGNPPWHHTRIARARDVLVERGKLIELSPPDKTRRKPGLYRLAATMPESVHYYFTPLSPSPLQAGHCQCLGAGQRS